MENKIKGLILGLLIGFFIGVGIHHVIASTNHELNMGPKVENVQNLQGGVSCQEYWYGGRKYLIFTSGYSSMQVERVN